MTDNRVLVSQDGTEAVRVNRADGLGVEQLRNAGFEQIVLSSETNSVVQARVNKLQIKALQSSGDKARDLANAEAASKAQIDRLNDENLLRGFGNNGGEEFLSYLMTSESMVITGGDSWKQWNQKIIERLGKIQNPNGSWNGHHCISSPVFCTAAVIQCCTTDRDAGILIQIAQNATKTRQAANSQKTAGTR